MLRNHLAQAAIEDLQRGFTTELQRLMQVLARPFEEQPGAQRCALPQAEGQMPVIGCSA